MHPHAVKRLPLIPGIAKPIKSIVVLIDWLRHLKVLGYGLAAFTLPTL